MRTYLIKVNNKTYEVEVEEKNGTVAATKISTADEPVKPAEPVKADESAVKDGVAVKSGATGKIWKTVKKEGDAVSKGEAIVILESMKMEIPVVAPEAGTISCILVAEGDSVEAGQDIAKVIPEQ